MFIFYVVVLVKFAGEAFCNDCTNIRDTICHEKIHQNDIFCGSDGKKYHGACAFWTASCIHNISVTGGGVHCLPFTTPTHHTTTDAPLTPFEASLYKSIIHGIDDRLILIKSKFIDPEKAKLIFSKQDHTNKVYVRNTDCWAYGLDLTCMSPWNSEHKVRKAGTLVSPRHVVWARHYNIPINTTLRFVDAGNNVIERRIIASKYIEPKSHSFWGRDIVVGLLERDVPSTIGFARVLPRNIQSFKGPHESSLPALSTDFEEKALVDDFNIINGLYVGLHEPSKTSLRHLYYEPKIVGDSGNPTFLIINNELVLLFVFTTGGAGGGTAIVHYYDEINQIMADLGGDYRLTDVNLNSFLHGGGTIPSIIERDEPHKKHKKDRENYNSSGSDSCHLSARRSCAINSYENMTYCASDGKRYHGLCSFLLAACDNHLSVVGYGESCTHPTAHPPKPTTTLPPTTNPDSYTIYSHLIHGIDDRLQASITKGVPADVAKNIYTKQDSQNKVFIRNKACWTNGLDLTAISPWNEDLGERKPAILISPKHILQNRHFHTASNSTVLFVDSNSNIVERTIVKSTTLRGPNIKGVVTDELAVGELDQEVPKSISFVKVLPTNSTLHIPYNFHVPSLTVDLEQKAVVDEVYFYSFTSAGVLSPSAESIRHSFFEAKTSGDSGSPSFLVLDGGLVLWLVYNNVGGSIVSHYSDQINSVFSSQGYKLSDVDVSKYASHTLIGK